MKPSFSFVATRLAHGISSALVEGAAHGALASRRVVHGALKQPRLRMLSTAASDSSAAPPSRRAVLALEDGSRFDGWSFGAHKGVCVSRAPRGPPHARARRARESAVSSPSFRSL